MVAHTSLVTAQTPPSTQAATPQQPQPVVTQSNAQQGSQSSPRSINCSVTASTDFLRHQPPPPTFRPAPDFTPSFFTNGHGTAALFRPGFPNHQHPAHHHPTVLPHASVASNTTSNGEFGEWSVIKTYFLHGRLTTKWLDLQRNDSTNRNRIVRLKIKCTARIAFAFFHPHDCPGFKPLLLMYEACGMTS